MSRIRRKLSILGLVIILFLALLAFAEAATKSSSTVSNHCTYKHRHASAEKQPESS